MPHTMGLEIFQGTNCAKDEFTELSCRKYAEPFGAWLLTEMRCECPIPITLNAAAKDRPASVAP
jgi:hypothetical protein